MSLTAVSLTAVSLTAGINLGSSAAVNPLPAGRGVYGAAKAATQTLSRVAAAEWGPDGIRVIAVLPAAPARYRPAGTEVADRTHPARSGQRFSP